MQVRRINADDLALSLAARRTNTGPRWAAMSNGAFTDSCADRRRRRDVLAYRVPVPPLLSPMHRGDIHRAIERTRIEGGLPEVRATWGCGIRALQAETANCVMRVPA